MAPHDPKDLHDRPRTAPRSGAVQSPATVPILQSFTLGPFATNCYIVRVPGRAGCWIVDAGYEPEELIQGVRYAGVTPRAIVLTHAHPDHIAGIGEVRRTFPKT